jgi:hypothetical protein
MIVMKIVMKMNLQNIGKKAEINTKRAMIDLFYINVDFLYKNNLKKHHYFF